MRSRRVLRLLAAFFTLAVSAVPALAQSGGIRGKVSTPDGQPANGAILSVDGTQVRAQAGSSGTYQLVGVPAGAVTLRVRLLGYAPATIAVTVKANETVTQDITLQKSLTTLNAAVVTGSRAQHTAAEELAVPVDVVTSQTMEKQGTTELGTILQAVSPSVNFPRQSVTDADDIVRPFTMRGLSPDHTLILVNGIRYHRTALVHTFAFGMPSGSTGVDLNSLPATAIDRMEVLRDGAAAQYGSDAIAGVVNLHMKEGDIAPYLNADLGQYYAANYPVDGRTYNIGGGWGTKVGRGSLGLFAEWRDRLPTNRAWAEAADQYKTGDADVVDPNTGKVLKKNNNVAQPNHHLGDGLAKDALTFANFRLPLDDAGNREFYAFGGYTFRVGNGNGFFRQPNSDRNWTQIYPNGFLPEFRPNVWDWNGAAGLRGKANEWQYDINASAGRNVFDYELYHTLNVSLGPCLDKPCAPGADGILGTADDPGIPNATHFYAGGLRATEAGLAVDLQRTIKGLLPNPLSLSLGGAYRMETFTLKPGEKGSWVQGFHTNVNGEDAPPGSQVFAGFAPASAADKSRSNVGLYAEAESDITRTFLANAAMRFENYSDFGSQLSSKVALRWQPQKQVVFRGAFSTGFRAPSLAQSYYGSRITSFKLDPATGKQTPFEVGIFPVDDPAAKALGSKPLKPETSLNLSGGLAWSPSDAWSFTVDGYSITLNDRILLTTFIGGDAVEAILKKAGVPATAGQYFTNIIDTRSSGVDITGNYHTVVGTSGLLTLSFGANVGGTKIIGQRDNPPQLAGTGAELVDMFARITIEKERPDSRATFTADYTRGRNNVMARVSYFGSFHSAPGLCETCDQLFGAKTVTDLEVGRTFGNIKWAIGARNLFDVFPDKNTLDNGYGIFPYAGASPFGYNGRFVYTRASITRK